MTSYAPSFRYLIAAIGMQMIVAFTMSFGVASEPQVVCVSILADNENKGREAYYAMDGNLDTFWHSQFSTPSIRELQPHPFFCNYAYSCGEDHPWDTTKYGESVIGDSPFDQVARRPNLPPFPHEILVNLQSLYPIEGFVYHPRNDGQTNGIIGNYEVLVSPQPFTDDAPGVVAAKGTTGDDNTPSTVLFEQPILCQYLKLRILSAKSSRNIASIAEWELLSPGYRFLAVLGNPVQEGSKQITRIADVQNNPLKQERVDEWNLLAERFKTPAYWKAITNEVLCKEALIGPDDRDPVDVLLRRVNAFLRDLTLEDKMPLALTEAVQQIPVDDVMRRFDVFCSIAEVRRKTLLESQESPLNDAGNDTQKFLFLKRHRSHFAHICDQFYGSTQRPGGGIFVLTRSVERDTSRDAANDQSRQFSSWTTEHLLDKSVVQNGRLQGKKLEGGSFLSLDLSFDGKKIAFAYVECEGSTEHIDHLDVTRGHWDLGRCYHIFTVNVDGSDLRQITDGTWNDFDPCWLPNGRIAFISERRNGYLRCGRKCPTFTLFDMNSDGSNIRCLSYHETNEWNPSVTNDGKIIYTRWDYVDRFGCVAHHPWITFPDGRDAKQLHGNFSRRHRRADGEFECRSIPNSPKFLATAGPHHGPSFGSLLLIDPRENDDDMGPVKRVTPDVGFPESQGGGEVFGTPWPLAENYFLCSADFSFQPGSGIKGADGDFSGHRYGYANKKSFCTRGNDGIYFCDAFGNRELIYRDPEIASHAPIPLIPRTTPPVLPDDVALNWGESTPYVGIRDEQRPSGRLSLVNVYDSLLPFPKEVKIKELRIIQLLPMSVPSGSAPHQIGVKEASSHDSVNLARSVLGTVPVEEDGSAHFDVPSRVEFLLQALDDQGCAVQSMRSSIYLQPGEHTTCNGCHEPKWMAPKPIRNQPKAFRRPPSSITPESVPGANPFSYPLLVQPILDKNCVACHALEESKTFSLAREPITNQFYASYNNLVPKYGFYNYGNSLRSVPGRFGARVAPLYRILRSEHYGTKLTEEERHRIVLWLDCLSNFYGVYEQEGGEAQLRGDLAHPTLE